MDSPALRLLDLAPYPAWCAWREEDRRGKPTKVPVGANGAELRSNDPSAWLTLAEARATHEALGGAALADGRKGGVGVMLGPLPAGIGLDGFRLVGIDCDTCIGSEGIEAWALACVALLDGYAEVSPSGTGVKILALAAEAEVPGIRRALGMKADGTGTSFKRKGGGAGGGSRDAHPPGIEAYLERRYFAVTWDLLDGTPETASLGRLGEAEALALVGEGGPVQRLMGDAWTGPKATGETAQAPWQDSGGASSSVGNAGTEALRARLEDLSRRQARVGALLAGDGAGARLSDLSRSSFAKALADELLADGLDAADLRAALEAAGAWTGADGRSDPAGIGAWAAEADARQVRRLAERRSVPDGAGLGAVPDDARAGGGAGGGTGGGSTVVGAGGGGGNHWTALLQSTRAREWRSNLNNAIIALTESDELKGMFALNEFSDKIRVLRRPPYDSPEAWKGERDTADYDRVGLAAWMQAEGLQMTPDTAFDAMLLVARRHKFDPVKEYLLKSADGWDGTERLPHWFNVFFGVELSVYSAAVGTKSLVGAVARVMQPGCKMDTITLLEGPQGIYKSTTLKILFGEEYFLDHIPDIDSKSVDAAIQLAGRWCLEHQEMDKLSRVEARRAKSFMSTAVDTYRRPYGRVTESVPRRCVFWGTLNDAEHGYLTDETGNRRYWPVRCAERKVDLRRLQDQRDQLWGEATVRYLRGEQWHLTGQAEQDQKAEAQDRFEDDVWAPRIRGFVATVPTDDGVTITDILERALLKPRERWTRADQMRIARTLMADGWTRRQKRMASGDREWRYYRQGAAIIPFPDNVTIRSVT